MKWEEWLWVWQGSIDRHSHRSMYGCVDRHGLRSQFISSALKQAWRSKFTLQEIPMNSRRDIQHLSLMQHNSLLQTTSAHSPSPFILYLHPVPRRLSSHPHHSQVDGYHSSSPKKHNNRTTLHSEERFSNRSSLGTPIPITPTPSGLLLRL